MSDLKIYESRNLITAMKEWANDYRKLKEKLEPLRKAFREIVHLTDFQGKMAEAIKGFYQAQIDVVEAWERFLDEHIRFLDDIDRAVYMQGLSDERLIHVPFLEDTLSNRARKSNQIVSEKEYKLKKILHQIDDIIPLEVFSREEYDRQMHQSEKVRKDTIEKVYELDRQLVKEYQISESQENYAVRLFMELMAASRKNGSISAINFDSEAYHKSAIYQLKDEMDQQEKEYLDFKGQQDLTWYDALEEKELQNRPWYEKVWSGVLQGSGNAVGDTVDGIKEVAELISPASIQKIINDPVGTLEKGYHSTINMPKYIWNAVKTAWDRDVIHGNAESRTAFFTYGLTSIGLSILGDKGISKIGNIAKLGNMAVKSAEYIPKIYNSPEVALAGGPAVSKPVPYNVLNDKKLLTQINTEVNRVYGSGNVARKALSVKTNLDDAESAGGHTIQKHVGKTDQQLLNRLQNDIRIGGSSSFTDKSTAQKVVDLTIDLNQKKIEDFMKAAKPGKKIVLSYDGVGSIIGRVVERGDNEVQDATRAIVVIKKTSQDGFVLTAYPKK